MKIFDEGRRTYMGVSTRSETHFHFLNRAGRPDFAAAREALEDMFAAFPDDGKTDLRARFRSTAEAYHGAFFELFLHTIFRRIEYKVALHPRSSTSARRVDFQIEKDGRSAFVEARTLTKSRATNPGKVLLNPILDAIDKIPSPNFFLHIDTEGVPKRAVPIKPITKQIAAWLSGLDHDKALQMVKVNAGRADLPVIKLPLDGCTLEISAWPKSKAACGKPGRAIGVEGAEAYWCDIGQRLKRLLAAKANRYGQLNAPYIIAANVVDGSCSEHDVLEALYGQETVTFTIDHPERKARLGRKPNGLWRQYDGPKYTRVSAVLIASRLRPWCVPQAQLTLYLNPWAKIPLPGGIPSFDTVSVGTDGKLVRTPGVGIPYSEKELAASKLD